MRASCTRRRCVAQHLRDIGEQARDGRCSTRLSRVRRPSPACVELDPAARCGNAAGVAAARAAPAARASSGAVQRAAQALLDVRGRRRLARRRPAAPRRCRRRVPSRAVQHARLLDRRGRSGRAWPRSRRTGRRDRANARTPPARRPASASGRTRRSVSPGAHAAQRLRLPGDLVGPRAQEARSSGMRANSASIAPSSTPCAAQQLRAPPSRVSAHALGRRPPDAPGRAAARSRVAV